MRQAVRRDRGAGRDAARTVLIRVLAITAIVTGAAYLVWRALFTLNPGAPVLAWSLWALEAYAVLGLALFTFALWDRPRSTPPTADPPAGRVAVLVTTYDEALEVILPVIAGAVQLDLAHETWVVDGGARPEVERLTRQLGAHYLAAPDGPHAKAGALNHALGIVEADFVAVFDADHVPHPDFLRRTLPHLADPRVALVQTPQDFYNQDSFEHPSSRRGRHAEGGRTSEQTLFYRVIQPAKGRWESAFWCGTGAVLRTAALRQIGGVATGSITEDLKTTIRLHRAGWRSVYHDEVLARGLAAPTAREYLLQRRRWCIGAMQTWRQERPLTDPSLSLAQRVSYAGTLLAWFDPVRTLGLLLLPPLVLLTGRAPIAASPALFIPVFGVAFALQQSALFALGRGQHRPISNTVFELVRMEAVLAALVASSIGRGASFQVTPKGRTAGHSRHVGIPHLLVGVASLYVVSFVPYVASLWGVAGISYPAPGVAHGAAFWAVVGASLMVMAIARIRSVRFSPEQRRSYRHRLASPADVEGVPVTVTDLSLTGLRLEVAEEQLHRLLDAEEIHIELLTVGRGDALVGTVVDARRTAMGTASVGIEFSAGQEPVLAGLTQELFHRY